MSRRSERAPLPVMRAAELAEPEPTQRWLVDSLWARAGVGIVGGAPKCCKSWLSLDIALSVASATPCLDVFEVAEPGAVLIFMAEDTLSHIKARLDGLCRHRGIALSAVPFHVITAPTLRLDLARDQERLRDTVRDIRPVLLVLDPFVRLHRIDENNASEVSALLAYLRALQREFHLAVLVVHHARKNGSAAAAGQALRGSGDFYAWVDSGLYLRRHRGALSLTIEHRAAPSPEPLTLDLISESECSGAHLAIVDSPQPGPAHDLDASVLHALADAPMSRTQLRKRLRVRNERLGHALERLHTQGRVLQGSDRRWRVPVPSLAGVAERNAREPA